MTKVPKYAKFFINILLIGNSVYIMSLYHRFEDMFFWSL